MAAVREVGARILILPFWRGVALGFHFLGLRSGDARIPRTEAGAQGAFSRPGKGVGRQPRGAASPTGFSDPARPTPTMTAHTLLLLLLASSTLGDPDSAGR